MNPYIQKLALHWQRLIDLHFGFTSAPGLNQPQQEALIAIVRAAGNETESLFSLIVSEWAALTKHVSSNGGMSQRPIGPGLTYIAQHLPIILAWSEAKGWKSGVPVIRPPSPADALAQVWRTLILQQAQQHGWSQEMVNAYSQLSDQEMKLLEEIQQRLGTDAGVVLSLLVPRWSEFMAHRARELELPMVSGGIGIPDIGMIHVNLDMALAWCRRMYKGPAIAEAIQPEPTYDPKEAFKPLAAEMRRDMKPRLVSQRELREGDMLSRQDLRALDAPLDFGVNGEDDVLNVSSDEQMQQGKAVLIHGGTPLTADQVAAVAALTKPTVN